MGFGARWVSAADPDSARALLHRVVELGVNLIDTADVYADGSSEEMIAAALHPYPDDLVIATKGGQTAVDGQPVPNGRPEYLRRACEESLRRLRVDTIELYQLHNPDPEVPLAESLGALNELQAEGKIRQIGVSNVFRENLDRALEATPTLVSVQNQFHLTSRMSRPEVDACEQRRLAFMPWCPLALGAHVHPPAEVGDLQQIAASRDATPAQVILSWLLASSPAMLPIPGTKSIAHLEENVAACRIELSADDVARLDALGDGAGSG